MTIEHQPGPEEEEPRREYDGSSEDAPRLDEEVSAESAIFADSLAELERHCNEFHIDPFEFNARQLADIDDSEARLASAVEQMQAAENSSETESSRSKFSDFLNSMKNNPRVMNRVVPILLAATAIVGIKVHQIEAGQRQDYSASSQLRKHSTKESPLRQKDVESFTKDMNFRTITIGNLLNTWHHVTYDERKQIIINDKESSKIGNFWHVFRYILATESWNLGNPHETIEKEKYNIPQEAINQFLYQVNQLGLGNELSEDEQGWLHILIGEPSK